jgi:hypothetical protein
VNKYQPILTINALYQNNVRESWRLFFTFLALTFTQQAVWEIHCSKEESLPHYSVAKMLDKLITICRKKIPSICFTENLSGELFSHFRGSSSKLDRVLH